MTARSSRSPWAETLAPYSVASTRRGSLAVLTAVPPYLALSVAMYLLLSVSPLLAVLLIPLTAGFLIRTFVVFHDCAHGSLLPSRRANAIIGSVLGLPLMTPFSAWRFEHAVHHATSGDLDRRGVGDVETMTVSEYNASSWSRRASYRAFRNPLVMFGLGPIVGMMIMPRIVRSSMRPRVRRSKIVNDIALLAVSSTLVFFFGWWQMLVVWLPVAMLAGSAGIWLFYVQHQFEDAYWQRSDDWDYFDSALRGSSYLRLPAVLNFFTANIAFHHLHHLNARIPCYYLPRAHRSNPVFAQVPTLTIRDGIRAVRLKLWDEQAGRLVTFAQARASLALSVAPRAAASGAAA